MIALLLVSTYILFVCFCLGGVFTRFLPRGKSAGLPDKQWNYQSPDIYFLGLCMTNVFFTAWSLFRPTDLIASATLFCICACYLAADFHFLVSHVFRPAGRFLKGNLHILLIPLVAALLLNGVVPPRNYDSGLSHMQMIKWIETYKVVPGPGNLHDRFAFNPNFFTLAAGTSFRAVFGQPVFAVNFVSLFVFFLWLLQKIIKASRVSDIVVCSFWSALAFILIHFCFFQLSSPTPDILASCVSLYVFIRFYEIQQENAPGDPAFFIPVLCCWLITIKLSTLPLSLLGLYILFKAFSNPHPQENAIARNRYFNKLFLRDLSLVSLISVMILISRLWAIYPGVDLRNLLFHEPAGWPYLRWFAKQPDIIYMSLILMALASPIHLAVQYFYNKERLISSGILAGWVISFIGVLYWFEMAPDIRFGLPYLLICSLLPLWVYAPVFQTAEIQPETSFDELEIEIRDYQAKELLFNALPVSSALVTLETKSILFDSAELIGKRVIYPANDERILVQK